MVVEGAGVSDTPGESVRVPRTQRPQDSASADGTLQQNAALACSVGLSFLVNSSFDQIFRNLTT